MKIIDNRFASDSLLLKREENSFFRGRLIFKSSLFPACLQVIQRAQDTDDFTDDRSVTPTFSNTPPPTVLLDRSGTWI